MPRPSRANRYVCTPMSRPARFESFRYLGDKRNQRVYDLDAAERDPAVAAAVDELLASECFAAFSPDTLAEARNRGYKPDASTRATSATERE